MNIIFKISNLKIFSSYINFGIIALIGILLNIFILKFFDIVTLGRFNFFFAFLVIFSQICVGGIQFSVLRNSSIYSKNFDIVSRLTFSGLFLVLIYFLSIITIYILFDDFFRGIINLDEGLNIKITLFAGLFLSLNKVLFMCINGLNLIFHLTFFNSLRYVVLFLFVVFFYILKINSSLIVYCLLLTESLIFLIVFIWLTKNLGFKKIKINWIKKHFRFGSKAMLGGALIEINTKLDILMIGAILGYKYVGVYSFGSMIAEGYSQLYTILKNNIDPLLSKNSKKKKENILDDINYIRKFFVPIVIFAGILILLLYKPIFIDLFKLDKNLITASWTITFIIMSSMTIVSFLRPFIGILIAIGQPFYFSVVILLGSILNITFNLILIPQIGMNGAAIATGIAFIAETTLLYYVAKIFTK